MSYSFEGRGCFPTGRHYPGIAHLLRIFEAGLAAEWEASTPILDIPWIAIDTETTGTDPATDRIVEIACIVLQKGQVTGKHSWLVNPGRPISPEATAVHGIRDEDVAAKPLFSEISRELGDVLGQGLPLAYNAEFDRAFVHEEFARAGAPLDAPALRKDTVWLDPLSWARELQKEHKSRALGEVCERLGIPLDQAHRATDDAEAAGRVLAVFVRDPRIPARYAAFIKEQKRLERLFEFERVRWR